MDKAELGFRFGRRGNARKNFCSCRHRVCNSNKCNGVDGQTYLRQLHSLRGHSGICCGWLGLHRHGRYDDVQAGFSVDLAGNAATTDAAANLSPTYSDGTKPTVESFTSTTANGDYKEGDTVNITANMSEVVLGGASITVTLSTGDTVVLATTTNSSTLSGTYTVPASKTATDLSVSSFVVTSAVKDLVRRKHPH